MPIYSFMILLQFPTFVEYLKNFFIDSQGSYGKQIDNFYQVRSGIENR